MHDEVAGLELGEIAEETGGADLAAGPFDGGSNVEEIGVAEKGDARLGKSDALGEWSADEQQRGGFVRGFGGEAGCSVFGFAEDIGDFVFAGDVGETLEFAEAGGSQENRAASGALGREDSSNFWKESALRPSCSNRTWEVFSRDCVSCSADQKKSETSGALA